MYRGFSMQDLFVRKVLTPFPAFVSGTGTGKFLRGVIEKSNRKEWFRAKLTVLEPLAK